VGEGRLSATGTGAKALICKVKATVRYAIGDYTGGARIAQVGKSERETSPRPSSVAHRAAGPLRTPHGSSPTGLRGARLPNAAHVDRHLPLIPTPPVNGFLASANA